VLVEVHQSHDGTNLWYHVGLLNLDEKAVLWGGSHRYDRGRFPMVAFQGSVAMEVHQAHEGSRLWYHVGRVNSQIGTVDWGESQDYGEGQLPQVDFYLESVGLEGDFDGNNAVDFQDFLRDPAECPVLWTGMNAGDWGP